MSRYLQAMLCKACQYARLMSLVHRLEGSEVAVDTLESLGAATAAAAAAALREAQPPAPPPPLLEGDFLAMLTEMLDRAGRLYGVMYNICA